MDTNVLLAAVPAALAVGSVIRWFGNLIAKKPSSMMWMIWWALLAYSIATLDWVSFACAAPMLVLVWAFLKFVQSKLFPGRKARGTTATPTRRRAPMWARRLRVGARLWARNSQIQASAWTSARVAQAQAWWAARNTPPPPPPPPPGGTP